MRPTTRRRLSRLGTVLAGVAMALTAGSDGTAGTTAERAGSSGTHRLYTFGHSYAAGLGASRPDRSWAALVAAQTCRPLQNRARSSDLSAETETRTLLAADELRHGDVVVIETGINDVRLFGPDGGLLDRYGEHIAGMLSHLRTGHEPVPVVLVADPGISETAWRRYAPYDRGSQQLADAYVEKLESVAAGFPHATVVDVRSEWSEETIAADGVHPDDRGHALVADAVVSVLRSRDLDRCRPVERIRIAGPDVVTAPYSTTTYTADFVPERTYQKAVWRVTELDGSPTDKASIDEDGRLTVEGFEGTVLITATAADGSGVRATKQVRLALDVALLRSNAARWPGATASASSEYSDAYGADKVRDGVVGAPDGGDWASAGEQDPWIELRWPRPVRADEIVLHDRAGIDDANGGELIFDDGTTVEVAGIPPDGAPASVRFEPRTFTSVRFQVRGGTGPNVGLAEIDVRAFPSTPDEPRSVTARVRDGSVHVSWRRPEFDGGAPLTHYRVTPYRDGTATEPITVGAEQTEVVVPGLDAGVSYTFTVAAANLVGTGEESASSDPVTPT